MITVIGGNVYDLNKNKATTSLTNLEVTYQNIVSKTCSNSL